MRNRDSSTFYRKTKETFKSELLSKGYSVELIEEYLAAHIKTEFKCLECGHQWLTRPANVLNGGNGCPLCSENRRRKTRSLSAEEFREKLKLVTENIQHVGDYVNYNTPTKFKCVKCNEVWDRRPMVALRGATCPHCSYSSGYNVNKPATAYVVRFPTFIKYGITNSPKSRLSKHRQRGMIEVIECREYEDGNIPLQWENNIKQRCGGKFVSKEQLKDGWTETLPINLLKEVCNLLP